MSGKDYGYIIKYFKGCDNKKYKVYGRTPEEVDMKIEAKKRQLMGLDDKNAKGDLIPSPAGQGKMKTPARKSQLVSKSFSFNGRRYKVYGKTLDEAVEKKMKKLEELKSGLVDVDITVSKWASVWYNSYVATREMTPKSLRAYRDDLNKVIIPAIGRCPLRSVTALQLQQLVNSRKGQSFSYAKQLRTIIKGMFRQAYINRYISFDPSADLKLPQVTKGVRRSLTDEEREALLYVANLEMIAGQKNTLGAWLLSMLYCGLRPGETAALTWDDVDLKNRLLHIKSAKESGSNKMKSPKTDAGVRDIPIPLAYLPYLEKLPYRTGYVFRQKYGGGHLTESSMRRMWQTTKHHMDLYLGAETIERVVGANKKTVEIVKSCLADDLVLYDLRHTYCTSLEAMGVPINIAKTLMGHSDIGVTGNIYTHSSPQSIETARRLIDGVQNSGESEGE